MAARQEAGTRVAAIGVDEPVEALVAFPDPKASVEKLDHGSPKAKPRKALGV